MAKVFKPRQKKNTQASSVIDVSPEKLAEFNQLTAQERGYTHAWTKAAKAYRAANPLCVTCQKHGIITPSECVDHIQPHLGDKALFWDVENWQALCKKCHLMKTHVEERNWRAYYPVTVVKPVANLTVIFGSPFSGKSTAVAECGFDEVIDLDDISLELFGKRANLLNDPERYRVLHERNIRLNFLVDARKKAVFINTSSKAWQKKRMLQALKPARWCTFMPLASTTLEQAYSACQGRGMHFRQAQRMVSNWYEGYEALEGELVFKTKNQLTSWVTCETERK